MAAQRADIKFINLNTEGFLSNYDTLLRNINDALSQFHDNIEHKPIDMGLLKADLTKLRKAFNEYNAPAINDLVKSLQKAAFTPDVGDTINEIIKCNIIGEFEEAIVFIDKILNK